MDGESLVSIDYALDWVNHHVGAPTETAAGA